jgi:hypothetical protein
LCKVVQCGLDILDVFENPFDHPYPVIHNLWARFVLYSVYSELRKLEWGIGKGVEGSGHGLFEGTIPVYFGMIKEDHENPQSR